MNDVNKNLGHATAYGYAKSKGYTGTEDEFAALMADYTEVGERAEAAATAAAASATAASGSASDSAASATAAAGSSTAASTAAGNASQAATTATTKASEAAQSATAAAGSATTASTKASEAAQSALQAAGSATAAESAKTAAQTAQTAAETAKTAAETAQGAAEDAAESVSASAAQIAQNTADISDVKSALGATLITCTASGAIATFTDGSDGVPMESVTVQMEPIQDLQGQDAPYPAGGGKNLQPYFEGKTVAGITFTVDDMGVITANGTATRDALVLALVDTSTTYGNFLFNGAYGGSQTTYNLYYSDATTGERAKKWDGVTPCENGYEPFQEVQIAQGHETYMIARVMNGYTANNVKFYPMLCRSTEMDTTYAPYSNICPISGRQSVTVTRAGKNLFPSSEYWEVGTINTSGSDADGNSFRRTKGYFPIPAETDITLSGYSVSTQTDFRIFFYDVDKNFITYNQGNPRTLTTPEHTAYFRARWQSANVDMSATQIEYGSTATAYEAPNIQTVEIQLGQTVYGGTVDAVSGVMTVDRAMVTYDGSEDENWEVGTGRFVIAIDDIRNINARNEIIANIGYYSESGATDGVGAMFAFANRLYYYAPASITTATAFREWLSSNNLSVVYYLATPLTIQLSAQQLTTLLGVNNVWSDGGNVSVDYVADTKLYIEQLTEPDADMVADANITSGAYFMVGNQLFLATSNIASGAAIVPGVNCTRTNLAEALNALNA